MNKRYDTEDMICIQKSFRCLSEIRCLFLVRKNLLTLINADQYLIQLNAVAFVIVCFILPDMQWII